MKSVQILNRICRRNRFSSITLLPLFKKTYNSVSVTVEDGRLPMETKTRTSGTEKLDDSFEARAQLFEKFQFLQWLRDEAPCFPVDGNKITVLTSPEDFYATLLSKLQSARRRIMLVSLYLGTGKLEQQLIETVAKNLSESTGEDRPKVLVLLDAMRASRGSLNSRKMLLPLLRNYRESVSVHLYHTPALRGMIKTLMPERWNEVVGLQHMKVYLFDDCLLISGANLSNDYFTNRQDRYILIEDSKQLADFYDNLVTAVSEFSLQLDAEDTLSLHPSWTTHPYNSSSNNFAEEAKFKIENLMTSRREESSRFEYSNHPKRDTWVFPLIQMGQLGLHMDSICTRRILGSVPKNAELSLASGYFNLTQEYMDSILNETQANTHILMAHPKANGFLGAAGFAGAIPSAYTYIAASFFHQVQQAGQSARIRLWEYQRNMWTFHAKGLWISFTGSDTRPFFTLIGSPNFGYRSVYRDLETQLAVLTVNPHLRRQLNEERGHLFRDSEMVTPATYTLPDRQIPLWVRFVIRVIKHFF